MSRNLIKSMTVATLAFAGGLSIIAADARQATNPSTVGGISSTTKPKIPTETSPPTSTTAEPSGPIWSSPNWRPVSGYTGDQSVYYTAGTRHALNRLSFYEHSDDPNHINMWLEELCHDQPCDSGPRTPELHVGTKEENLKSKEIIAAGDDHYITAIQVCTTNENDVRKRKIKGARIWTARLDPGGVVNRTGYDPVEFDRPNCNNHWREKQLCLGNRVAVGIKAYYNDDSPQWNNRYYITGLELQCAAVSDPSTSS